MTQRCGGRVLSEEEIDRNVRRAMELEEKKELRRLGKDFESRRIEVVDNICGDDGAVLKDMDAIVLKNKTSSTNSLSQTEWLSMEAAMPAEERQTHRNLQLYFTERAKSFGVDAKEDEDDDDDDDPEIAAMLAEGGIPEGEEGEGDDGEEEDTKAVAKKKIEEEDKEEVGTVEKGKNWSSVNLCCQETKLSFRGSFSAVAFTNWLWWRCIRPKLEETKSSLDELSEEDRAKFSIDDIEEVLGEYCPKMEEKKDKKDKKDSKDDKKDKKDKKDDGKSDKKDAKDSKKDDKKDAKKDDKKKKKDKIELKKPEQLQVQNLIKNMVYGESSKSKTIVEGWVPNISEKNVKATLPWEVQLAQVMYNCLQVERSAKKEKATPSLKDYYECVQSIADAISFMKKQYQFHFPESSISDLLPMQDAFALQKRFKEGSVYGTKFELLWYFQNGAHLLAGSPFAQKHRTTVFKPFKIQELMVEAIMQPGPQLVFGIAPPGTGKTAVVAHVLNLFPAHSLVFCCPALPVVLSIGKIANSLGLPYAFCKGRRITPSYSCGRGLGTHVDMPQEPGKEAQTAVSSLRYAVVKLNLERKARRLAEKKRKRNLHDLKRFPRMFLMCDTASCAWLLRQLDPNRTILVVDEPPMGSDRYPETPEENCLAAAMMQTMMTPMYKTILMSATLPRPSALPVLVNSFLDRFKLDHAKKELHVRECFSTELDRGAVMCGPSGAVGFPHQRCESSAELKKLCLRLPTDPLVLKAYTERALAALIQRWQALEKDGKMRDGFLKRVVKPEDKFADLSDLNHASIRGYALELLQCVADEDNDEFVKAFCSPSADAALFPAFSLEGMLFSNAWAFPGLTLVSGDEPMELMMSMSAKLREQFPKLSELEADLKKQEESAKKAEKFKEDDEGAAGSEDTTKLKFSPELVIQSEQFLKRWCPSKPDNTHHIQRLLPTVTEFLKIKDLPVEEVWQMLALSGAGSFDPKLDADPSNPVYTQWVLEAMNAHKLACVTAGKEFTWGANVPASTVVVTKSFADTTSVAGMLQYVGRAARRGLTTHGQAIFERDEDMDRIFASPDGLSTEALTMERYAQWWLSRGKVW
mmetsp:Transcript_53663/g.85351  ORF Transcript_53663/g.85351 Transcript_53663/m.85351 type:complete len:1090 (+) Transcript_53663:51-3320(+)|eukprot:CAMPEP_0169145386 /NCGR_PEP_ID=MMETSP1015-20121227/46880_1 /TAXON_ID=342587 /ORGANISM="Karlodinium micrum, Strain CCMP2283" /LENGTH=1089 /DNA_ID=CAMNT_0009212965 /DNA_START=44 /DNA_END=3310 /DNA_ORIENTATION=+